MEKMISQAISYDLLNPATLANPYPVYKKMREEDPVHFLEAGQFWVITRHKDVLELLRSPNMSADRSYMTAQMLGTVDPAILKDYIHLLTGTMLNKDAPDHTVLRKIANQGFLAKFNDMWCKLTQQVVDDLIDRVEGKDRMELISEFANILPCEVIAGIFGVPREERDSFQHWGSIVSYFFGAPVGADMEAKARECNEAAANLVGYFHRKIDERQKDPKEDVISLLIAGYEGGKLNRDELASQCALILSAGFITTIEMIPNAVYQLLAHPDQVQKLHENPALLNSAVEETLRFDTSVPFTFRIATADVAIGKKVIRKGQVVALGLAAANHDPEQFPSPDVFDITRTGNKHVAFGFGAHYCLGAPLAKIEIACALETLFRRLPNLRLDEENPPQVRAESFMFKGHHSMWVKF